MIFSLSFLNPPKGKVLRKRSPTAQNTPLPSRAPTRKSSAPELTFTAPPAPAATIVPDQEKGLEQKVKRASSLRKRNSRTSSRNGAIGPIKKDKEKEQHVPPRQHVFPVSLHMTDAEGNIQASPLSTKSGEDQGGNFSKRVRRKSLVQRVLEKRRERIEAGNLAYGDRGGRNGSESIYDPRLGVENLPLAQYSGLHIGSPLARIGRESGGEAEWGRVERSEVGGRGVGNGNMNGNGDGVHGIGIAIGGEEERAERARSEHLRVAAEGKRQAYWGDYPSSQGGSLKGSDRRGYGGEFGEAQGRYSGKDHERYSGGNHEEADDRIGIRNGGGDEGRDSGIGTAVQVERNKW